MNIPRVLSLVKISDVCSNGSHFTEDETFVFFGEIPNMKEHCVVMGSTSKKFFVGYHVYNFVECSEEEI